MSIALIIAQEENSANLLGTLIPFALVGLVMYFLIFRPQKKRRLEAARLMSALGVGDEVVTTSGVYGFISGEDDELFWLEIDDDVQIRIAKAAIARKVSPSEPTGDAKAASDSADGDEADAS